MALVNGNYVHRGGEFVNIMSTGADQNVSNPQSYPLQPNNTIVKLENPNVFALKVESPSSSSDKIVFPPEFNQQQQTSSSPSNSNENNASGGVACEVCGKVCESVGFISPYLIPIFSDLY